jgi:uncharacterized protein (DUF427 family)
MATAMESQLNDLLPQLRYQDTIKRVRAFLKDDLVADTTRARLLWEPMRVVPSYAVPGSDVLAELVAPATESGVAQRPVALGDGPPVLDPSTGFAAHTTDGESLAVVTSGGRAEHAAYRLADPDLEGYVALDFYAFSWLEEDEPIVGHPRDPFSRIDVRASSRHVRLELDGVVLAESTRPQLLFESGFPMARYYLPREDVAVGLQAGTWKTTCAYKGHATHYHARVGDDVVENVAWSYEEPLSDAIQVKGLVSFYQERLDLYVDGEPMPRPKTPWSPKDS